jgi:hypothetical protein
MEVNKVLHEERVRILSEMPEKVIIAEDNITEDNIDENLKTTENINMDATM